MAVPLNPLTPDPDATEVPPGRRPGDRDNRSLIEKVVRALPIRWRILAISITNVGLAVVLVLLVWNGARSVGDAWADLRQVRRSERVLVAIDTETRRLQGLIHRYLTQARPELLAEIERLSAALGARLRAGPDAETVLGADLAELEETTARFLRGFEDLRAVRAAIAATYESDILRPAREMGGLYSIIDGATRQQASLVTPALGQSREAFNETVLAANAYYLSLSAQYGDEAKRKIATIERTIPVMLDLADSDLQRNALTALRYRTAALREGLDLLTEHFATQALVLRDAIDGNATRMSTIIETVTATVEARERDAQARFDVALAGVYTWLLGVSILFLIVVLLLGIAVSKSIRQPLKSVMSDMNAIANGRLDRRVRGIGVRDEIGAMARAVEVFRENAIAKDRAEGELVAARDRAEQALARLQETQEDLIEAEKLAALGGLVAGVAHEVNNPVGISLTVASSLGRRAEGFARDIESGQVRRSALADFVAATREAAAQLVGNLARAGELVQSFKQVAVDRSHADRRTFDLAEATEQIVASLKPGLRKAVEKIDVTVPEGIVMESYPGPYGQVITNLFLNAAAHAFADRAPGTITLVARRLGRDQVEVVVGDDGRGMTDEVKKRAFEPFFTTRRGEGGTGLGLHIVYNIVTGRLGGQIVLHSEAERGTRFRMVLPLVAPREDEGEGERDAVAPPLAVG